VGALAERVAVDASAVEHEVGGFGMMIAEHCNREHGGSARDCVCRLPGGGWLECPESARRILPRPAIKVSGDICLDCGSANVTRAGTCLLCQDCGSTNGGCT